jgi:hypothetical protein
VHRSPILFGVGSCGSVLVEDLKKTIKKRRVGGHSPTLGVNHVYPVLWLFCAL